MLALMLCLSMSVFADGEIPIGGRTCPPNQVCRAADSPEPTASFKVKEVYNSNGFYFLKGFMNSIETFFY